MSKETYGRGQVEWALWCSFADTRAKQDDLPQVFRTRIKRLLDVDRDLDVSSHELQPDSDYAFAAPPTSEGVEAEYQPVDAFCLGVALDLLDSGFKQSEVVFLMRYLRSEFERCFPGLLKGPSLLDRQHHSANEHPSYPTYDHRGVKCADARMFMVLKKVELKEILPSKARRKKAKPFVFQPDFCAGIVALGEKLDASMPYHRRAVTVLELAAIAQAVQKWLPEAPAIRRGRPKS